MTGSCDSLSDGCSMVCQTAKGCLSLDAYFIDGTLCGAGGKCKAGTCADQTSKETVIN